MDQDGVLSYILAPLTLRPGDQAALFEHFWTFGTGYGQRSGQHSAWQLPPLEALSAIQK